MSYNQVKRNVNLKACVSSIRVKSITSEQSPGLSRDTTVYLTVFKRTPGKVLYIMPKQIWLGGTNATFNVSGDSISSRDDEIPTLGKEAPCYLLIADCFFDLITFGLNNFLSRSKITATRVSIPLQRHRREFSNGLNTKSLSPETPLINGEKPRKKQTNKQTKVQMSYHRKIDERGKRSKRCDSQLSHLTAVGTQTAIAHGIERLLLFQGEKKRRVQMPFKCRSEHDVAKRHYAPLKTSFALARVVSAAFFEQNEGKKCVAEAQDFRGFYRMWSAES